MDVHLVEASGRPGGVIRSERRDGYLLEFGPQSFSATPAVLRLCRELQIESQLIQAASRAPRFVLTGGNLRAVPLSPPAFMASSLFSAKTKLRVLRDVLGHSVPPQNDESVAAFVLRKFSPELLEKLVGPFVSGIFAGDPERLSVRSAFPQLYEAEKSAGSVIRGLLRDGKEQSTPHEKTTLRTFRDGNQTLADALAAEIGSGLHCNTTASSIRAVPGSANSAAFEVSLRTNGRDAILTTDRLIVATPTQQAAVLLRDVDPEFEVVFKQFEYAPVAVVSTAYARKAVRQALDGFGFLAPRSSGLRVLGTVWNSSLFPGRAPEGHLLLTSFVGGATNPKAIALSTEELVRAVHLELAPLLGISQEPSFSSVWTYDRAIPQFNIGHAEKIRQLGDLQTKHPNLWLTGNYLRGPSLGACIEQALTVAQQADKK
jgi:protoporphyrinogen/coproporphyrinogen III oxidase